MVQFIHSLFHDIDRQGLPFVSPVYHTTLHAFFESKIFVLILVLRLLSIYDVDFHDVLGKCRFSSYDGVYTTCSLGSTFLIR